MIIDMILDRKDGIPYDPGRFYSYCLGEESIFKFDRTITRAMDYGTEDDVREALCSYVIRAGYNPDICNYVRRKKWLEPDGACRTA